MVGDVMADASQLAQQVIGGREEGFLDRADPSVLERDYALLTLHRAENTDDAGRIRALVEQLNSLEMTVVFPLHPRTRNALHREGLLLSGNILTLEPVGYLEMAALLGGARLVLTDSGGLQKEAYWSKTPCVTLRTETEWVETVEAGWNILVGDDVEGIPGMIEKVSGANEWAPLYGDGKAAERIAASLAR